MENFLTKLKTWHIILINIFYLGLGFSTLSSLGIYSFVSIFFMILPIILFDLVWRKHNGIDNGLIFGRSQYINLLIFMAFAFILIWLWLLFRW